MRHPLLVTLFVVGSFVCFAGYCIILTDWLLAFTTGIHERPQLVTLPKVLVLILYAFLAIRFIKRKISPL